MDSCDHISARLSQFDEDLNRSGQEVQSAKKKAYRHIKKYFFRSNYLEIIRRKKLLRLPKLTDESSDQGFFSKSIQLFVQIGPGCSRVTSVVHYTSHGTVRDDHVFVVLDLGFTIYLKTVTGP